MLITYVVAVANVGSVLGRDALCASVTEIVAVTVAVVEVTTGADTVIVGVTSGVAGVAPLRICPTRTMLVSADASAAAPCMASANANACPAQTGIWPMEIGFGIATPKLA
jgi:hypothetical protein